jgi:hypothetical protein
MPLNIGEEPDLPPKRIKDYGHWYIREDCIKKAREE